MRRQRFEHIEPRGDNVIALTRLPLPARPHPPPRRFYTMSERKQEKDFSKEVDTLIPEATELAKVSPPRSERRVSST